ncbi:MAG: exonuclease domain-containing protein [Clostridia bacterium]|nr:exonuclease domain-containing protein [Clostridia bacterium]
MSNYVVIDLEMCRVPKLKRERYRCKNEIIEIGAVLLDGSLEIVDSFKSYVYPEYGVIDSFIQALTGISKRETASAPKLNDALNMLFSWIPEGSLVVTWSENDEFQIKKETDSKGIRTPEIDGLFENCIDCQVTFSEKMASPKTYSLSEALIIAGIDYDEGAHDALVDAHNTGLLFAKMMRESELTLNPYYSNQQPPIAKYNPFADLLMSYKCTA